jgi:hypothetical protein
MLLRIVSVILQRKLKVKNLFSHAKLFGHAETLSSSSVEAFFQVNGLHVITLHWTESFLQGNIISDQENPSILWNPKVQYHIHKIPQLAPVMSQTNPVYSLPTYFRTLRGVQIKITSFRTHSNFVTAATRKTFDSKCCYVEINYYQTTRVSTHSHFVSKLSMAWA